MLYIDFELVSYFRSIKPVMGDNDTIFVYGFSIILLSFIGAMFISGLVTHIGQISRFMRVKQVGKLFSKHICAIFMVPILESAVK